MQTKITIEQLGEDLKYWKAAFLRWETRFIDYKASVNKSVEKKKTLSDKLTDTDLLPNGLGVMEKDVKETLKEIDEYLLSELTTRAGGSTQEHKERDLINNIRRGIKEIFGERLIDT